MSSQETGGKIAPHFYETINWLLFKKNSINCNQSFTFGIEIEQKCGIEFFPFVFIFQMNCLFFFSSVVVLHEERIKKMYACRFPLYFAFACHSSRQASVIEKNPVVFCPNKIYTVSITVEQEFYLCLDTIV